MANTYSASLLTDKLEQAAVTILQNQFAPLAAFAREFGTDPLKPRATVQVKLVTAGSTTLKNAASFESGDATVNNVAVAVDQYSQPFAVSNSDLNSGLRLEDLATINAKAFAQTILDTAFAPITEANYGAAVVTSAAAAFGWGDMPTLWAAIKKSDVKTAVIDSEFYARLLTQPTYFQALGEGPAGAKVFGWDGLYSCSRFNGAGASVKGFACNPQAIAVAAGPPIDARAGTLDRKIVTLAGLNLSVAFHTWFSLATRSMWASYDLVFGAAKADTTALAILKST